MTYRTLLVHLDGDARCAARVESALALTQQFKGHLIGLAATGEPPPPAMAEIASNGWAELAARSGQERRARAQAWVDAFDAQALAARCPGVEGLVVDSDAESAVVARGRWSDLVIVSQGGPQDSGSSVSADFPQRVFMETGRPVLLIPRSPSVKTLGRRVVVGWSDTREAARALADAMPLLQAAQEVLVLNIDRPDEAGVSRLELNDLQRALMRHGVNAECQQASTEEDYGETLLQRAQSHGADLIVMGGFGHARWAQLALGGVTRTVLGSATVPVLVSR